MDKIDRVTTTFNIPEAPGPAAQDTPVTRVASAEIPKRRSCMKGSRPALLTNRVTFASTNHAREFDSTEPLNSKHPHANGPIAPRDDTRITKQSTAEAAKLRQRARPAGPRRSAYEAIIAAGWMPPKPTGPKPTRDSSIPAEPTPRAVVARPTGPKPPVPPRRKPSSAIENGPPSPTSFVAVDTEVLRACSALRMPAPLGPIPKGDRDILTDLATNIGEGGVAASPTGFLSAPSGPPPSAT